MALLDSAGPCVAPPSSFSAAGCSLASSGGVRVGDLGTRNLRGIVVARGGASVVR